MAEEAIVAQAHGDGDHGRQAHGEPHQLGPNHAEVQRRVAGEVLRQAVEHDHPDGPEGRRRGHEQLVPPMARPGEGQVAAAISET